MKKAIALLVVFSLVMFSVGFVPQSYAQDTTSQDKISQAAQAANETGANSGEKVEKGISIGTLIAGAIVIGSLSTATVLLLDESDNGVNH